MLVPLPEAGVYNVQKNMSGKPDVNTCLKHE